MAARQPVDGEHRSRLAQQPQLNVFGLVRAAQAGSDRCAGAGRPLRHCTTAGGELSRNQREDGGQGCGWPWSDAERSRRGRGVHRHPDGRRRSRVANRLRQHRRIAAGAYGWPTKRNRYSVGARSRALAHSAAATDRKHNAGIARRSAGRGGRVVAERLAARSVAGSIQRPEYGDRVCAGCAGARLYAGAVVADWDPVRPCARAASVETRLDTSAERCPQIIWARESCAFAQRAGCWTDRLVADPAGKRGFVRAHAPQCADD